MTERVTLQTIADHLGVSRTTVSNAYNRPDQLGDELRDSILAAAAQLGYRGPDAVARMLRTGRVGAIGLLFTEDLRFVFTDPDTTRFMQGVAETSALAGTGLTLLPVPDGLDVGDSAVPSAAVDGYLVFSVVEGHPDGATHDDQAPKAGHDFWRSVYRLRDVGQRPECHDHSIRTVPSGEIDKLAYRI